MEDKESTAKPGIGNDKQVPTGMNRDQEAIENNEPVMA
jgi:hypothetical protein